jgi:hypothetical protein
MSCCMAKALWIVRFGVLRRYFQDEFGKRKLLYQYSMYIYVYLCKFGPVCLLCPYIDREYIYLDMEIWRG